MSSSTSTIIEVVNLAPTGAEKCKSVEEYDSASSRDILGRQGMSFDKYKFKPLNFGVSQLIIASDGHWSGAEMVIIISGAEKKPFAVHRTLLVEKCSYFKAALSENFMEGQSKVIRWPEVSSDIVAYFLTWLYSGDIRNEDKLGQPLAKVSFGTLTKLYIFAIRYSITALSDASCKQITKTLQHWDRFDGLDSDFPQYLHSIVHLWENLSEHNPLRRTIRNSLVYYNKHNHSSDAFKHFSQLPADVLASLAWALLPHVDFHELRGEIELEPIW